VACRAFWSRYPMRIRAPILLLLIAISTSAFGEDPKTIEKRLSDKLANGLLVLRTSRVGTTLRFDANGATKSNEGIRGFDDKVEMKTVQLRGNKLILKGVRLHDIYDPKTKKVTLASVNDPIEIDVQLSNPNDETSIAADYHKVFLSNAEIAKHSCSDVDYLARAFERAAKDTNILDVRDSKPRTSESREVCLPSGSTAWLLGDAADVVLPRPTKDPDPDYPDLERVARKPGQAQFMIRVDESGRITDGVLLRTDSLGFVLKSTQTFHKWRFSPGKKDGVAVPSVLTVEMNFHMMH